MTHKLNKVVLLLTAFASTLYINACNDNDDSIEKNNVRVFPYLVTTDNLVESYFKPRKANIYTKEKAIFSDWVVDDNTGLNNNKREYAEQYFFLDQDGIDKYISIQNKTNDTIGSVMVDKNDIISPYKEFAEYYGDTNNRTIHSGYIIHDGSIVCALPLVSIDVICNKPFDENHPAGSKLNDILYFEQMLEMYNYFQNKEKKDEITYFGVGRGPIKSFQPRKLSDITNNPVYLMESYNLISFDHEPVTPGTYEFTVKFTFGADPLTGETVEIAPATVSIDF